MNYLLGRIQRNLVGLLGFIQRDVRQSGFQPVAFELRIDDRPDSDDPDAPRVDPVQLDDGRGHTVRIVGTVDRVDTMELGGKTYIRVVDYKTGSKKFDLREVYYGLDCQMLLYLFTLERNGGHLFSQGTAAGVEYLWADPAPENIIRPETDDAEPLQAQNYPLEGLLLDEPSLGLAPLVVKQIFQILRELTAQGMTLFLVEQNARHALNLSDRAYVMVNGQIRLSGSGQTLLNDPEVRKAYLGISG